MDFFIPVMKCLLLSATLQAMPSLIMQCEFMHFSHFIISLDSSAEIQPHKTEGSKPKLLSRGQEW